MKLKFTFSLFALLVAFAITSVLGQKTTIDIGTPIKTKKPYGKFVGYGANNYYELAYSGRVFASEKLNLRKYDKKLNVISEAPFGFNVDKDKKLDYEGTVVLNGKFYVFSSRYEKKTKEQVLYVQSMNSKDDLSAPIELIKSTYDDKGAGSFSYTLSPQHNFLMIYQRVPSKRTENEELNVYVYDQDMKLFWKKNVELKYSSKNTSVSDFDVSDVGSAFIRLSVYNADKEVEEIAKKREQDKAEGKKKNQRTIRKAYLLLTFSPGAVDVREHLIELKEGNFITDISSAFNTEGMVAVGGFYADKNNTDEIKGSFYNLYEPGKKEIVASRFKPFSQDVKKALLSSKIVEKVKDVSLGNYNLDYFIPDNEGGVQMVAQEYYEITYTRTDSKGHISTYTVFCYGAIIILSYDAEGNVKWTQVIDRLVSRGQSGYVARILNENIYIIYSDGDESKTTTRKKESKKKGTLSAFQDYRKSVTYITTISPEGKLNKNLLYNKKETGIELLWDSAMVLEEENAFLFKSYTKKKNCLVRVNLK